jgi:hypothetical protein
VRDRYWVGHDAHAREQGRHDREPAARTGHQLIEARDRVSVRNLSIARTVWCTRAQLK